MHPKMTAPDRRPEPSDAFVEAFAASMPNGYRERFDKETVRAHAGVVFRRGISASRALPHAARGGLAICVAADDRPGLFSHQRGALRPPHGRGGGAGRLPPHPPLSLVQPPPPPRPVVLDVQARITQQRQR
jgi:hypothetical protein